ncbi:hypothetical protein DFH27DRAFT_473186, partial [Peziza echinospora]
LSPVMAGPFRVKRVVAKGLAYELDLPDGYQIHPVISIAHLEDCPVDTWGRQSLQRV